MRISVPSMGTKGLAEEVSPHFGRAPIFTIYDTETEKVEVVPNTSTHMGGQGYPPELMHVNRVDIMLCSGLGPRAVQMFEQLGIRVYVGAMGTVKTTIDAWKNGTLQEATDENVCKEHRH
ncbi:MAG: NifB/NifX family molybdenum-iron cluster-binding protein [Promethearchaeota archaeon]